MQTIHEQVSLTDRSLSGIDRSFSTRVDTNAVKTLKIREFISWSVCFAVISFLTGLLLFLNIGITMETVTSGLFYLSLAGLIYFLTRIVLLTREPVQSQFPAVHELN